MTITQLINNWCPKPDRARTFIIPYCCHDDMCEFIWGDRINECDMYNFLESNSDICIYHRFTTDSSYVYLSDKYSKATVAYYTFYNNDLFIIYKDLTDKSDDQIYKKGGN